MFYFILSNKKTCNKMNCNNKCIIASFFKVLVNYINPDLFTEHHENNKHTKTHNRHKILRYLM